MPAFAFRALPVFSARDATLDFEQLTFALNKGDLEINAQGELKVLTAAALTGAWTNPEGFNAKLTETTTVQVRKEQGATSARLKGVCKAKEEIVGPATLFTLPVGFRPPAEVIVFYQDNTAITPLILRIKTNGVSESSQTVPLNHFITFDGITFNLT